MPSGGHFEERDKYLLENKIYENWRGIFEKYATLALDGQDEALTRAVFFIWYQCSEPNQLSGLALLNEEFTNRILARVNTLAGSDSLHHELKFMLPFYYQVCEWYFERFENMESLYLASKENLDLWEIEAPKQNWNNRGIMGEYWSSKGL